MSNYGADLEVTSSLDALADLFVAGLVHVDFTPEEAASYYLATGSVGFAMAYEGAADPDDYDQYLALVWA